MGMMGASPTEELRGTSGVSEAVQIRQANRYWCWPIALALILAACHAAMMQYLFFVPVGPASHPTVRTFLLGLELLSVFVLLAVEAILVAVVIVTLVGLRLRRTLTYLRAALSIPIVIVGVGRIILFNPYFWYVLFNLNQLEAAAKSAAGATTPGFVKLEGRDVSTGLVINLPTFTSIIYDESDEVGLAPTKRSQTWVTRNEPTLLAIGDANFTAQRVDHLPHKSGYRARR